MASIKSPINKKMSELRITEIFHSLQGEASSAGWPTVFIRLTGCPLRCVYCDTEYAFQGGEIISLQKIMAQVKDYACDYICVTGGEPLAQKECLSLLTVLCDEMYYVSLETSGAMDIAEVDPRAQIVMDLKAPGSKEESKNRFENLEFLKPSDIIKFVLNDKIDYEWAKTIIDQHNLYNVCELLFSPVYENLKPRDLAQWILDDKLQVRFQMQLHKVLWGDTPGR